MPLYDFKCSACAAMKSYHLSSKTYDEDKKKLSCFACGSRELERNFLNQRMHFSGMFKEQTIGGVTFATETAKKAYEKENGYIPLSYEENMQETSKNRARIDKEDSIQTKKEVAKIVQAAIKKNKND